MYFREQSHIATPYFDPVAADAIVQLLLKMKCVHSISLAEAQREY
jgi:hypothetical protein